MSKFIKKYYIALCLLGIGACLLFLNIIARLQFNGVTFDLTENQRYSLSEYSCRQASILNQPLYMTIYYSADMPQENPVYAKYAEYVMRLLKQYQHCSQDKIFIALKNPQPYSETENEAKQEGITPLPSSSGQTNLYFGIVLSDADGKRYKISEFSMERDFWLEKDITTVLSRFNEPNRKIVGLISPLHKMITRRYGRGLESYAFIQELSERYDILELAANVSDIPENIDTLIVVAPLKMPQSLAYALDQYVLRGGKLIMLLDTLVENPRYKMTFDNLNGINRVLANWGVQMSEALVGSRQYGKNEFMKDGNNGWRQTPYPLWLDLPEATFKTDKAIMTPLKNIHLRSAVELKELEHTDDFKITSLIQLDKGGNYILSEDIYDKNNVVETYQEENRPYNLAVLIEGKFHSLFEQIPSSVQTGEHNYLYYSQQPAQILLVGDSDFVRDDVWLEDGELNDNGQLVLRAVEIFNNQQKMADLYKSQMKLNQESLGSRIYKRITDKYLPQVSRLQQELEQLYQEHNDMRVAIEQKTEKFNAATILRDTEIKEKIEDLQQQLQYNDYQIKNNFKSETQNIIIINLIVFPVGIVLLWIGIYGWLSRRGRKKIKENFNAR